MTSLLAPGTIVHFYQYWYVQLANHENLFNLHMSLILKQARLLMGFKDTGLIYFLLTLLAATATGTFTIFLIVTYTLARYVTLGG